MDLDVARRLVGPEGAAALEVAARQPDPGSLAAATALRREFAPDLAAAALDQIVLRRRARTKLGPDADHLFLTRDGLEQATRPAAATHRASALRAAGVDHVVDLTTGLGLDARAMRDAGITVRAIERDPATAVLAAANLAGPGLAGPAGTAGTAATVHTADARDITPRPGETAFLDPARRSAKGRSWRLEDLAPPWDFVADHLGRGAWAKLGPGLPYRAIPAGCAAEWVQVDGDLVEVMLRPGSGRTATLLSTAPDAGPATIAADDTDPGVRPLGRWLVEPDPALIRAGALGAVAAATGLGRVAPDIAYLTGDTRGDHPGLTWFAVHDALPLRTAALRAWMRDHRIGTLEIKKRGIDLDPARLRATLRPKGPGSATLILTPTPTGTRALVTSRA